MNDRFERMNDPKAALRCSPPEGLAGKDPKIHCAEPAYGVYPTLTPMFNQNVKTSLKYQIPGMTDDLSLIYRGGSRGTSCPKV